MIRLFVACAPNHEDAESQAVLEWSVRKHASEPVEITWMKLERNGVFSNWVTSNWPTPFSGLRWAVPELCDFKGRAIYCDSDMIWMADIAELWNQPIPGGILAKSAGRLCVSLWDCEKVAPHCIRIKQLRADPENHRRARQALTQKPGLITPFSGNWNCLDGEDYDDLNHPDIKVIHYTSMKHQPHLPYALERLKKNGQKHWFDGQPLYHWREDLITLFDDLLIEAAQNGYTPKKYCEDPIYGDYKKLSVAHTGKPGWSKNYDRLLRSSRGKIPH